jgi:NitT/TauT family transport system substrate-binding protein
MDRRSYLRWLARLLAASVLPLAGRAGAGEPVLVRLNIPGPRSLPFLPIELITPLGIDRDLGAVLKLRYFTSGVLAFEDMAAGNAHFSGHGFTILPAMRKKGKSAVAIASIAGSAAALALVVRTDLAGKIKRVADLKSRSIGASSGSVNSKTYLQMVGEQVLADHGVASSDVRWVQTAQNWESVRAALASKSVDAVLCEEPFATRAVTAGLARFLYSAKEMAQSKSQIGGAHLRAVISTPTESPAPDEQARLLVQMVQRSLQWMAKAKPEDIVSKLPFDDPAERKELLTILARYPEIFSRDGRFPAPTIAATISLLQALGNIDAAADVERLIVTRWAGPMN